jgi:hypothetical protein
MIEFTTGLLMIASAFSSASTNTVIDSQDATASSSEVIAISRDIKIPMRVATTEEYVRESFKDTPLLAEIARCESTFRQYGKDGKALRGIVNDDDIGVMQINRYYHEEDAQKLGLNIYTLQGNIEFAKVLYGRYGDKPWVHSSPCWKKFQGEEIARI